MLIFEVGQHSHVVNKVGHKHSSLEMSPSCHLLHLSQLLSLQSLLLPSPSLLPGLPCRRPRGPESSAPLSTVVDAWDMELQMEQETDGCWSWGEMTGFQNPPSSTFSDCLGCRKNWRGGAALMS